jgi:hypothetical protein
MMPRPRQHAGVSLTDPIRTLVDLAAGRTPMAAVIDRALALQLTTVARLEQATRVDRDVLLGGRAALRRHLVERGYWGAPNPSVLESRMARLFEHMRAEEGVPCPKAEVAWVVDQPHRVTEAVTTIYRRLAAGPEANGDRKDQLSDPKC